MTIRLQAQAVFSQADQAALAKTLISIRGVMRILRVRHATVKSLIENGSIQTINVAGKEKVTTASLRHFIEAQLAEKYADTQPARLGQEVS